MKKVHLSLFDHRGKKRIKIDFPFDNELKEAVDRIEGRKWSQSNRCWYVDDTPGNLKRIFEVFKGRARVAGKDLFGGKEKRDKHEEEFEEKSDRVANSAKGGKPDIECVIDKKFEREMKLRGKMPKTIETYKSLVNHFLQYYKGDDIGNMEVEKIKEYIMYKIDVLKYSKSYQNQLINALKKYFEYVYERTFEDFDLPRPKRSKRLPKVISEEGVKKLIGTIKNKKHKALISLIYSAGLRRQEALDLEINDIDSKRMVINIRRAKGDKDRIVGLSPKILEMLKEYYKEEEPKKYLFEGADGVQYSATSVWSIFKKAKSRAGIKLKGGVHLLRHSFATHLHERGVDIRIIQEILGHKSSKTTELYTHVSRKAIKNIQSPFDDL